MRAVITGRALANWVACGKTPPHDHTVCRCMKCTAPITISPEGMKVVLGYECDVLCNPCAFDVVKKSDSTQIGVTVYGAKAMAELFRKGGL